jgi:hypothetical protein
VLLLYCLAGVDAGHLDAWPDAVYRGVVEERLARSEVIQRSFEPRAFLPLGSRGAGYLVLGRVRQN